MPYADAERFQQRARANARALQDAGRTHRPYTQDDLAAHSELVPGALPKCSHCAGAGVVQQHLVNLHAGQHGEVGTVMYRS
ncbi:hypothetical protein D3C79_1053000 [compost metagenome]